MHFTNKHVAKNSAKKYEVVYTEPYYDIGLAVKTGTDAKSKRVLTRAAKYYTPCEYDIFSLNGSCTEYGGAELLNWVHTGIFLTIEEWKELSFERSGDEILRRLGVSAKETQNRKKDIVDEMSPVENSDKWKEGYAQAIEDFSKIVSNKISDFVLSHQEQLTFVSGVSMGWRLMDEAKEELKEKYSLEEDMERE